MQSNLAGVSGGGVLGESRVQIRYAGVSGGGVLGVSPYPRVCKTRMTNRKKWIFSGAASRDF